MYLRRYENIRERLLTIVNNLVMKTIKESFQTINLQILKEQNSPGSADSSTFQIDRYFTSHKNCGVSKFLMSEGLDNMQSEHQFDFA